MARGGRFISNRLSAIEGEVAEVEAPERERLVAEPGRGLLATEAHPARIRGGRRTSAAHPETGLLAPARAPHESVTLICEVKNHINPNTADDDSFLHGQLGTLRDRTPGAAGRMEFVRVDAAASGQRRSTDLTTNNNDRCPKPNLAAAPPAAAVVQPTSRRCCVRGGDSLGIVESVPRRRQQLAGRVKNQKRLGHETPAAAAAGRDDRRREEQRSPPPGAPPHPPPPHPPLPSCPHLRR